MLPFEQECLIACNPAVVSLVDVRVCGPRHWILQVKDPSLIGVRWWSNFRRRRFQEYKRRR